MLRYMKAWGIYIVAALLVLVLGAIETFIFFNNVESTTSYALGFAGVFGLLLMLAAFYWAKLPRTRQWPGTLIGFGIAVAFIAVFSIWEPFNGLRMPDFGFGLLSLLLVVVASAIIAGASRLTRTATPPKAVVKDTTVTSISQTA